MHQATRNFNIPLPLPRVDPGHLNFWWRELTYLMTRANLFVCEIPLLENNRRRLQSFRSKIINIHSLVFVRALKNTSQRLKTFFSRAIAHKCSNVLSLHLNSSISSKHVFIAVRRSHLKPDVSGSIFPTPPWQRSNSPLREGLPVKFLTLWAYKIVKFLGFSRGEGGCSSFDLIRALLLGLKIFYFFLYT